MCYTWTLEYQSLFSSDTQPVHAPLVPKPSTRRIEGRGGYVELSASQFLHQEKVHDVDGQCSIPLVLGPAEVTFTHFLTLCAYLLFLKMSSQLQSVYLHPLTAY